MIGWIAGLKVQIYLIVVVGKTFSVFESSLVTLFPHLGASKALVCSLKLLINLDFKLP